MFVANLLWITYAWVDNDEGDFDFLVQELGRNDIPALYDKIALVPGRRLWSQIADKISHEPLAGWAYLVTPNSISSNACQEELAYALQRALDTKGEQFPLIGLLHGVSIRDVPLALRVRLCVNVKNPDWVEEIRAAILGQPPRRLVEEQGPYIIKVHNPYLRDPNAIAVEIRPRFGELTYWRIGYPVEGPRPSAWGSGPANGGGISAVTNQVMEGVRGIQVQGIPMEFVGAGNTLSPSTSAYIVFQSQTPSKLFFGVAKEAFGLDVQGVLFDLSG